MGAPEDPALSLLHQAHPTDLASTIFQEKVRRKPLVLRPTSPDPNAQDARATRRKQRLHKEAKSRRRAKMKPLSAKEKKDSGLYDIDKENLKYDTYLALHNMWQGYMQEILGLKDQPSLYVTAQGAGSKLASAEYHGAHVRVVRSRCAGLVGLEGIVVRDTKFTFQTVSKNDKLKSTRLDPCCSS